MALMSRQNALSTPKAIAKNGGLSPTRMMTIRGPTMNQLCCQIAILERHKRNRGETGRWRSGIWERYGRANREIDASEAGSCVPKDLVEGIQALAVDRSRQT
jgi:hypothetical protein